MPEAVADGEEPSPIVPRHRLLVLVEIRHIGKRAWQASVFRRAQACPGSVLERAQAQGERKMLLVVDVLVVKDEHRVLVHPVVNGRHLVGGERFAQIDSLDLGGKARPDLSHLDRHCGASTRRGIRDHRYRIHFQPGERCRTLTHSPDHHSFYSPGV